MSRSGEMPPQSRVQRKPKTVQVAGAPLRVPKRGIPDLDPEVLREEREQALLDAKKQRASLQPAAPLVPKKPVAEETPAPSDVLPDPGPQGELFTQEELSPHRKEKPLPEEGQSRSERN